MHRLLLPVWLVYGASLCAQNLPTRFESSGGKETFTYHEGIRYCGQLDSLSEFITLKTYGSTDAGFPLHLLVFDTDKEFKPGKKRVILVNNAIHPGEPDGVEASLMFIRDIATQPALRVKYRNAILLVIPFYNIGGTLNRGCCSRANQNGPSEYGFRGNSKNLDLNRDFIKADALETLSFYQIFHEWKPAVFVDTHVSNGADYQYTMTLIHTPWEKYPYPLNTFIREEFIPALYTGMKTKGQEMSPYVNVHDQVPDSGFGIFNESPRYSNGYASLFNCIGLVPETHMLKPFDKRVLATYQFLETVMALMNNQGTSLNWPNPSDYEYLQGQKVALAWEYGEPSTVLVDGKEVPRRSYEADTLLFRGYKAVTEKSKVTGLDRLRYLRDQPFEKKVPYRQAIRPSIEVIAPQAYVLKAGYNEVVQRLLLNGVRIDTFQNDTQLTVSSYRIRTFETVKVPYESHYLHHHTEIDSQSVTHRFRKGDLLILPDKNTRLFVMSVLEPRAPDSYFNWNFFDGILQQKEWFSDYVFEDLAADLLNNNDSLRKAFVKKKKDEPEFAGDSFQQLYFIYRHSPYFEQTYMRYPVFRIETGKER